MRRNYQNRDKMSYVLTQCYLRALLPHDEQEKRLRMVRDLERIMDTYNIKIKIVGSCAYNLSIRGSDLDIVCLVDDYDNELAYIGEFAGNKENKQLSYKKLISNSNNIDDCDKLSYNIDERKSNIINQLKKISQIFEGTSFFVENILSSATFPIIQLRNYKENIKIDMSINQYYAIENTKLIQRLLSSYPEMKQIIVLVKKVSSAFGINCSYQCTLSSYSICLMTIFYFQVVYNIPSVFSNRKMFFNESLDLYENLKGFFFYYGYVFNYNDDAVSVKTGKAKRKNEIDFKAYNAKYNLVFCIEDPFLQGFNVTRTVNEETIEKIIKVFRVIFYMLANGDAYLFK